MLRRVSLSRERELSLGCEYIAIISASAVLHPLWVPLLTRSNQAPTLPVPLSTCRFLSPLHPRASLFPCLSVHHTSADAEGGGDADESARAAAERATQRLLAAYRGNSLVVWGTGTNGQLGLGPGTTEARTPTLVPAFEEEHSSVRFVACSSTHAAAIAGRASSLYVWGHNRFHALGLGPDMESTLVLYAPARVTQFGTIVDGVGRGTPRSVACGKYFTVVATHAYAGMDAREAAAAAARGKLMEDDRARASELEMRRKLAVEKAEEEERLLQVAALNELSFAAPPPCSLCSACSGFQADPFAPSLCRYCAHLRSRHNTKADLKRHALLGSALLKPPGAASAGSGSASGAGTGGNASSGLREHGGHSFRY